MAKDKKDSKGKDGKKPFWLKFKSKGKKLGDKEGKKKDKKKD